MLKYYSITTVLAVVISLFLTQDTALCARQYGHIFRPTHGFSDGRSIYKRYGFMTAHNSRSKKATRMEGIEAIIDEFDKNKELACSPTALSKIIDTFDPHVVNGTEIIDSLVSSLIQSSASLEEDYSALYSFIMGEGDAFAVISKSYLFLIPLGVAILIFLIYIFGCIPKLCCSCARKCCCCCVSVKQRKIGYKIRTFNVVFVTCLAFITFIFIVLVFKYQVDAVNSTQGAHCYLYQFVDDTLRGTQFGEEESKALVPVSEDMMRNAADTGVLVFKEAPEDEIPDFAGLLGLGKSLGFISNALDRQSQTNVLVRAKHAALNQVEKDSNPEPVKQSISALNDLCKAYQTLKNHESMWCIHGERPNVENDILASLAKVNKDEIIKQTNQLFVGIDLPDVDLESAIPLATIENAFVNMANNLIEDTVPTTSTINALNIGLNIDASIALCIVVFAQLWGLFFFFGCCSKNTFLTGTLWNLLSIFFIFSLFIGGLLGWVSVIGRQSCGIFIHGIESNDWDFINLNIPDMEPITSECISSKGSGSLLRAYGLEIKFYLMYAPLEQFVNSIKDTGFDLDVATAEKAMGYKNESSIQSSLFLPLQSAVDAEYLNVAPEVLQSGIQEEDKTISQSQTVYGLKTLEGLVSPWKLRALHPELPEDDQFVINANSPVDDDPSYLTKLNNLKAQKEKEYIAEGVADAAARAEEYMVQLKNAIWWAKEKHKILDTKFDCVSEGKQRLCTFREMFGITNTEIANSYVVSVTSGISDGYLTVNNVVNNAGGVGKGIFGEVTREAQNIHDGLNCKYIRKASVEAGTLLCDHTARNLYNFSQYRCLSAGFGLLLTGTILLVWRYLKDNKHIASLPAPSSA